MNIVEAAQGSRTWHEIRVRHFPASEASAMMSASKYMSRTELLKLKKTGIAEEVTPEKQALFDRGHAAEAAIRPHIEALIGEELFPVVGISEEYPALMASFDGLTMLNDIVFEHKLWNEQLVKQVVAVNLGKGELDPHYTWQLEQQLLVSGAKKALFVVSDGTPEKMIWCWYTSVPERRAALIAGWDQFAKDLLEFEITEVTEKAKAEPAPTMPALFVQLKGEVSASNLAEYKAQALTMIQNINTDLKTDQDFATAENMVKFCKKAEDELDTVKKSALAQTASIDELFRTVDDLKEAMRQKRLELDKLVKAKKEHVKHQAVTAVQVAFSEHLAKLNKTISVPLPAIYPQFAEAIKGKKTIASIEDALQAELARSKVEANQLHTLISNNLKALDENAPDYKFLFNDLQGIVTKQPEDFTALVIMRVQQHQEAEKARLNAERERIQKEEAEKAENKLREAELMQKRAEEEKAILQQKEQQEQTKVSKIFDTHPAKSLTGRDLFLDQIGKFIQAKGLSHADYLELVNIIDNHYRSKAA